MLLFVLLTAAALRFWQLGQLPAGLYRDEAFNGLDALDVLEGQHSLFFSRNNGREPVYIYLTTVSISLFGRSPLALRLAAAVIGTLTTWLTYQLAKSWFGWQVGLLSAWLWAVTVWPVHLGRIGLRVGLMPAVLALVFWLGTLAYRKTVEGLELNLELNLSGLGKPDRLRGLWLLAGAAYGAAWYTYLAVRFTPILLIGLLVYLLLVRSNGFSRWPARLKPLLQTRTWVMAGGWFAAGAFVVVLPLALLAWQRPEMILGRSSQVSILNPAINEGHFWRALWQHSGQALGMFFWRGDTILRHNPAGRPVFDPLMAIPFVIGLVWCLQWWRQRPAAATVLLWIGVMLGPTILAEDTPHFLRAAGVLPAAVMLPALGLSQMGSWTKLPRRLSGLIVVCLLAASLAWGVRDYFFEYGRSPETAYLFEAAGRDLAEKINNEAAGVPVFLEDRLWDGWPSVQFLVERPVTRFRPVDGLPAASAEGPAVLYVWPYQELDYLKAAIQPPAVVLAETGSLARGDLEPEAYPLFVRYAISQPTTTAEVLANFNNEIQLRRVEVDGQLPLQVDLYWSTELAGLRRPVVVFVHVMEDGRLIAQDDAPPAQGHWPISWWQPGLIIQDRHLIQWERSSDSSSPQLMIGLYDAATQVRLPLLDEAGKPVADFWLLPPGSE